MLDFMTGLAGGYHNMALNFITHLLLYFSVPISIRFFFLKKPIQKKWVVIAILVSLYIVFGSIVLYERNQLLKRVATRYNVPPSTSRQFGSPLLGISMILSYFILTGGKLKQTESTDSKSYESNLTSEQSIKASANRTPLTAQYYTKPLLVLICGLFINVFFKCFFYTRFEHSIYSSGANGGFALYMVESFATIFGIMLVCTLIVLPIFLLVKLYTKKWESLTVYIAIISIVTCLTVFLAVYSKKSPHKRINKIQLKRVNKMQPNFQGKTTYTVTTQESTLDYNQENSPYVKQSYQPPLENNSYQYQPRTQNECRPRQYISPFTDNTTNLKPIFILEAQQLLTSLGYHPGAITGQYNLKTIKAVSQFETDYNLVADGRLDKYSMAYIREAYLQSGRNSIQRNATTKKPIKKKINTHIITRGTRKEIVIKLQGEPDTVTSHHTYEVLHYRHSSVKISLKDHKVISWYSRSNNPLMIGADVDEIEKKPFKIPRGVEFWKGKRVHAYCGGY